MDFINSLRKYLLDQQRKIEVSDMSHLGSFYVIVHSEDGVPAMLRCKVKKSGPNYSLDSISPIRRFNENQSPWDTTIKDVHTVFSSFPGIAGVANRQVNNSLVRFG
jgi:hypothetical protein